MLSTAPVNVSGRVTSPMTTCASEGSWRALSGVRTRARTVGPWRIAFSTTNLPMLPVAPMTSTVMRGPVTISPFCSQLQCASNSRSGNLINDSQGIEHARIADEWEQLRQDIDQPCAVIADMEVRHDMAPHLRFASTECHKHAEREQLACGHIDARARVMITETVGREIALYMLLISRSRGVEFLHDIVADNLLLNRETLLRAVFRRGRGLARQGQLDASLGEHFIGGLDEVKHSGDPYVRHGLVQNLLGLNWSDPDVERRAEHGPVLAHRLAGDDRCELDHQPGPNVQIAVTEHLIEGEVVEDLDQFGVGHRSRGDVAGKKFIVVLLCSFVW